MIRIFTIVFLFFGMLAAVFAQGGEKARLAVELFNQGQDAHEKGDIKAAVDLYAKAIELLPEFPEAELQRGAGLLALDRREDAERALRRALELREGWSLAEASLGSLLVSAGKFDEAEKLLVSAAGKGERNALVATALAELRLRTNASDDKLREVLQWLDDLARRPRPTASVFSAKAAIEQRIGDAATAKASAARALESDPKLASAHFTAAELALGEDDVERAEHHLKFLEKNVSDADRLAVLRARVLAAKGQNAEAVAVLEKIDRPSKNVLDLIGRLKGGTANLAELETALAKDPSDVTALAGLCRGYRLSDPAKSLEFCRRANAAEPNNIGHAIGFGAALVQAKRYEDAAVLFRKLLTAAPENATIRANLATALFQLKRFEEAKPEFLWLVEKQPGSPAAFFFLAIVHDRLGEYMDALANYQHFLRAADPAANKLEIEQVNLRLPSLQKQIKDGKGKKS